MTKTERQNRALNILNTEVRKTLTSDEWKAALDFRRKFHKYSLSNILLIRQQLPTAQLVAGYRAWQQHGRQVRKGEKSIAILAPITRKVENANGEDEYAVFGFRTASVFDISQTDGDDYPELPTVPELTGDADAAKTAVEALMLAAKRAGVTVRVSEALRGEAGSYNPAERVITITPNQTVQEHAGALAHELAHALAGHEVTTDGAKYQRQEFEAETAAYLILAEFGLATDAHSFGYLANWAGDESAMKEVMAAGSAATKVADKVLALTEVAA